MDEKALSEIEARAKAATPGPWKPGSKPGDKPAWPGIDQKEQAQFWSDAAFIAHAREDVPALVSEVRRLLEVKAGLVRLLKDGGLIG